MEHKAKGFAAYYHSLKNQRRKYTDEPYIVHPEAVVALIKSTIHTEEMVAAAWLHDVVEDTTATIQDIENIFGMDVAALVEMLTDISTKEDGNRARRKHIDLIHTSQASHEAKTIKLADLIDNTKSIVQYDPNFAKVYLQEKGRLLTVLTEGDPLLYGMACKSLRWGQRMLVQYNLKDKENKI